MPDWRSYDDLAIGENFPAEPHCYVVTDSAARGFRTLVSGSLAAAGDDGLDGAVPPMLAAVYIRGAQNALKGPPGGIHARQRFAFLAPVHVGDTLDTVLTVREKYEKKGRRYVVSETRTRNQHGVEVTVGEIVSIWGKEQ